MARGVCCRPRLRMPTLLFWNVKGRPLSDLVGALARQVRADIVVLAEPEADIREPLKHLNEGASSVFFPDPLPLRDPVVFSRFLPKSTRLVRDAPGLVIREYSPPLGPPFLVAAVHLPSKLHRLDDDYHLFGQQLSTDIERAEAQVRHTRTILIGDFNMNPFESGMSAAGGIHAVMDRRIALREKRKVRGSHYRFFYNPMWSWLGDRHGRPGGTCFYDSGKALNLYWNMLDQVLLRPSLLHAFDDDSVRIVTEIGGANLLNDVGRPDKKLASDHLPIVVHLKDFKEKNE